MTLNISSGRLLIKSRPAGVACDSSSPRLHLLAASFSTSSVATETSVSIFTSCSGASGTPTSPLPSMGCFGGILIGGSGDIGAAKAPKHGVVMETEVAVTAGELSLVVELP